MTIEAPRRYRCRRCEKDPVVIGTQLLCPECTDSYNQVVTSSECVACRVHRDAAIDFYTRLDREGMYCQQCVGNQAQERCTIDRGIGILEVVRANVVSDVEVQLEPDDREA